MDNIKTARKGGICEIEAMAETVLAFLLCRESLHVSISEFGRPCGMRSVLDYIRDSLLIPLALEVVDCGSREMAFIRVSISAAGRKRAVGALWLYKLREEVGL